MQMTMDPGLRYEINIFWSSDNQIYVAEVPELGCVAEGTSYEAALLNVKIVTVDLLDMARKVGRPLPEPTDRRRSVEPL
jgi:predicted RNase H-like HicB family nuclease